MAKPDNEEIRGLRDILDYRKQFDIYLACDFETDMGKSRIPFYEDIGKIMERLGKRTFLPHKELDLNEDPGRLVSIALGIVLPSTDIVLAYLGGESGSTGIVIGRALASNIPVSYLYEENGVGLESLKYGLVSVDLETGRTKTRVIDPGFRGEVYDLIEFKDDKEALKKIDASMRAFYRH